MRNLHHVVCVFVMLGMCTGSETNQPEQIHICYGSNADKMVVMWATHVNVTAAVQYGETSDTVQYLIGSDVSQLPAVYTKAAKYIHRAELTNLTAGKRYFYKVVTLLNDGDKVLSSSDMYNFKVPERDSENPMKFLVYGDMGANEKIPTYGELERHATEHEYTAILHVGDFAYNLHTDWGRVGDVFLNKIQPFAARVPYLTSPGNHEIHDDFIHYRTRFSSPGLPWPIPLDKMWYSFDIGLVHFVSYSTEVFFSNDQRYACVQFDWLLKDLITANKNRDTTPWIIAIGHRPMYCTNGDVDDCAGMFFRGWVKYGLEDLFHAQGVDLIIEAHEHSYERLWPVYNGKVTSFNYKNPQSSTHIISGAAGNVEGINWMKKGSANPWSAFRADRRSHFSFGTLEIHNKTHLNFKQISATTRETVDSFWLEQHQHGPFVQNVDCSGAGNHRSCYCPFPYFFVIYIVAFAVSFIVLVATISFMCYWSRKKGFRKQLCAICTKNSAIYRFILYIFCLRANEITVKSIRTATQERDYHVSHTDDQIALLDETIN